MALNAKQRRFVDEYLIDLNATQAAVRAGYSFCGAVGYYTYLLIDPRDGAIFYVGKGKGARMCSHAKRAIAGKIDNAEKHKRITKIHETHNQVLEVVFSCGESEKDAFSIERELIDSLRNYGLTNIAGGVVSNAELAIQQAKYYLAHMKSFEEWQRTAKPYQVAAAINISGSAKACFDRIRDELMMVAELC